MSIQGNINQALSIAGLLATQSGRAKFVKEGQSFQAKQEQAIKGLEDIEKNLYNQDKYYSEEERKDIKDRVSGYTKDIYDAKSAALNPQYKGIINSDLIKQPDLSSKLINIKHGLKYFDYNRGFGDIDEEGNPIAQSQPSPAQIAKSNAAQALRERRGEISISKPGMIDIENSIMARGFEIPNRETPGNPEDLIIPGREKPSTAKLELPFDIGGTNGKK